MEALQLFKKMLKFASYLTAAYLFFSPELSQAQALTAEYKCTNSCTFCITYPKKTVCSDKYSEDSAEYAKARKLSKFVNDGLIVPDEKLKPGFNLDVFAQKYFNCELMIKKADQIREATQNMCVSKVVQYKKMMVRSPASSGSAPKLPPVPDKGSR